MQGLCLCLFGHFIALNTSVFPLPVGLATCRHLRSHYTIKLSCASNDVCHEPRLFIPPLAFALSTMIVSSSTISTFSTSLIVLLSMVTAYVAALSIRNLILSPLKHIPGPWYAAISDFWLMTHIARFRQSQYIHSLFDHYDSVVRVGPNKVMFNDLASSRSVYSVHRFDKSIYYKSFDTYVHVS